ncbi:MAG TPA: glycosyltransferase [Conexibacter sp.]|nr:glycosyltransferase [Conexibacter sp.]
MRLAVYTDYEYVSDGERRYGQRAFVVFLEALREHVDRLVLVGRMDPRPQSSHYPLNDETELVGLPHYESLAKPLSVVGSLVRSVTRFWRLLDEIDVVWVLGPYPHAVLLAGVTLLRRRRLVLGVRQDTPTYIRTRRPEQRWMHVGADLLDGIWRLLARRHPTVVVGPDLAESYRRAPELLAMTVSLVSEAQLAEPEVAAARDYDGPLTALTVGRVDTEKNPLLLADIVARLNRDAPRWRLVVCGEGPLVEALAERVAELGVADAVELRGYLPVDGGLLDLYRESHAFLHVSLTEGFPQVLVEAFGARLPVVATAVGGVPAAAEGAALLVPPRDAEAAAAALERIADDPELRERLIAAGAERARAGTLEASSAEVAAFLERSR